MKQQRNELFRKLCFRAGIVLLTAACATLLLWQWGIRHSRQQAEAYVASLRTLMPEPRSAFPEPQSNPEMPVLSLDGTDFVGILEIPRCGSVLPVGAEWGKLAKYPCRLSGSIYDGSLQIGGSSQQGQYHFYREISVGDGVFFTDAAGNRYSYTVTDIRYEQHADQAALQRNDAALTLFIKNIYAFEYIIVFCDVQG